MNFYHLLSDELKYELRIRGHTNIKTVADMRAKLASLSKSSRLDVTVDPADLDVTLELELCEDKLNDILQNISSSGEVVTRMDRFISRLIHIQLRLGRLVAEDTKALEMIRTLKKDCDSALKRFNVNISGETGVCCAEEADAAGTCGVAPEEPAVSASAGCGKGELQIVIDPSRNVNKWNIKYSGRDSKVSLHAFLERVEELRITKNVSVSELLRCMPELLEGEALEWYRFYGKDFVNWFEFIERLKSEFLPSAYNRKTLKEIYNRTQHISESATSYIYIMKKYFGRLDIPMVESEQIEIIKENLAPFYKSKLYLEKFNSVDDMRLRCKQIEDLRKECQIHENPTSSKYSSTHVDLGFCGKKSTNNSQKKVEVTEPKPQNKTRVTCNLCKRKGHVENDCWFRHLHCHGCGKVGVTRPRCEKCKPRSLNSNEASTNGNT